MLAIILWPAVALIAIVVFDIIGRRAEHAHKAYCATHCVHGRSEHVHIV